MSSAPTDTHKTFLADLARLVGPSHLLTDPAKTQRYRKGFRSGQGEALAVVFPGTLLELWRVLNACVDADKIILMQAANTGLTEGSTPNGNDYDREIVIISTLRLDKLHLLDKGEQGQVAAVVQVGVGENHRVDLVGRQGQWLPVAKAQLLVALEQPAIHQHAFAVVAH